MGPFGERLKQERERRKMTLDDVALATKIGTRMLSALEEEKFERLPGGIFNKGFVRAYARHLGLDDEQAVADYLAASGGTPAVVATTPRETPPPEPPPLIEGPAQTPWGLIAVTALLVMVAVGLAVWGFSSRKPKPDEVTFATEKPKEIVASPAPATSAAVPNEVATPLPADATAHPPVQTAAMTSSTTAQPAAPATPAPGAFLVLVKAREESWVSILADGNQTEFTLSPGRQRSIEARKEVKIKAGNVGALDFWFNGEKLAGQGENNEVRTLIFGPEGLEVTTHDSTPATHP